MGNHHAEEDLEDARRRDEQAARSALETWNNLPAQQKVDMLERRLAMINERAVMLRDQIGFGCVFSDLRQQLHALVEHSRNYRSPI